VPTDRQGSDRHRLQLLRRHDAWGTILSCEEGLSDTFGGDASKAANAALLERYSYDGSDFYGFARFEDRLVLDKEPKRAQPLRLGLGARPI
jgi:hypothetical protein